MAENLRMPKHGAGMGLVTLSLLQYLLERCVCVCVRG